MRAPPSYPFRIPFYFLASEVTLHDTVKSQYSEHGSTNEIGYVAFVFLGLVTSFSIMFSTSDHLPKNSMLPSFFASLHIDLQETQIMGGGTYYCHFSKLIYFLTVIVNTYSLIKKLLFSADRKNLEKYIIDGNAENK